MENNNNSPFNIRSVAKTSDIRIFSQNIRSDVKTSEVATLLRNTFIGWEGRGLVDRANERTCSVTVSDRSYCITIPHCHNTWSNGAGASRPTSCIIRRKVAVLTHRCCYRSYGAQNRGSRNCKWEILIFAPPPKGCPWNQGCVCGTHISGSSSRHLSFLAPAPTFKSFWLRLQNDVV